MSAVRTAFVAGLDALPFAALAVVAAVVFGLAGALSVTLVATIAAFVGVAVFLVLATFSANRYHRNGKRFYFTRIVVVEGLLSLP